MGHGMFPPYPLKGRGFGHLLRCSKRYTIEADVIRSWAAGKVIYWEYLLPIIEGKAEMTQLSH